MMFLLLFLRLICKSLSSIIWNAGPHLVSLTNNCCFFFFACCLPALSAGIICALLALGEAGIEMYDLVSSCSLVKGLQSVVCQFSDC